MQKKTPIILFALAVLLMFFIGGVEAATAIDASKMPMGEWIHSSSNAANTLLCSTVGDPIGLFGCKGQETAIWPIIKTFNLAVLSFAGLWMAWNIVSAVMSSAADGEFLGKRNSSTWVPIRLIVGWAMIIPAFGGWNLAQLIMLWAAAVGSGIAGSTAVMVSEKLHFGAIYSTPTLMRAIQIEPEIVAGLRCLKSRKEEQAKLKEDGNTDPDVLDIVWKYSIVQNSNALLINTGAQPARGGYSETECGQVTIALNPSKSTDPNINTITDAIRVSIVSNIEKLVDYYDLIIDINETEESQGISFPLARDLFDKTIDAAANSIVLSINKSTGNSTVIKAEITERGWVGLGFQGIHATKAAYEINEASASTVTKTDSVPWYSKTASFFYSLSLTAQVEKVYNSFSLSKVYEVFSSPVNALGNAVGETLTGFSGQSPIIALQSLGVKIVVFVAGLAIAILVLVFFFTGINLIIGGSVVGTGVAVAAGSGVTSLTIILMSIFMMTGIPLLFFGLKLAGFIPFLIAIMWSGAILAWLMIVFESLLGAPLWALVHLDTDGEGMGQKTTHGYLFLLNLLFRPIILVFSLAAATLAMNAIFALFGSGIASMITNTGAQPDGWLRHLIMIIGAIFVVVFAAETIITQSLSFLWNIPNNVFTWLGGNFGSNVGQGMEAMGNDAKGAMQNTGKAVEGLASGDTKKGLIGNVKPGKNSLEPTNPSGVKLKGPKGK